MWVTPQGATSDLEVWLWRGGMLVLLALAIRWVIRHRPEPDFQTNLMPPYEGWDCPLCGAQLLRVSTSVRCTSCKAEHQPLTPARA